MVFSHLSRGIQGSKHHTCVALPQGDFVLAVGRSSYLRFDIVPCRSLTVLLPLNCDAAALCWAQLRTNISCFAGLYRQPLL